MDKEITLEDKSSDFQAGFHAGVQWMKDEEDRDQVSMYLLGQLKEEDLSPRQMKFAQECMQLRDSK